jgi:hypothetical protein
LEHETCVPPRRSKGARGDAPSGAVLENEKGDDVNEGAINNDESSGDIWFGVGVGVVTGIGDEKGSAEGINKSFGSMVRCWTGALCWDASKYCTSDNEWTCHSSSNEKGSSSIMETGAWVKR